LHGKLVAPTGSGHSCLTSRPHIFPVSARFFSPTGRFVRAVPCSQFSAVPSDRSFLAPGPFLFPSHFCLFRLTEHGHTRKIALSVRKGPFLFIFFSIPLFSAFFRFVSCLSFSVLAMLAGASYSLAVLLSLQVGFWHLSSFLLIVLVIVHFSNTDVLAFSRVFCLLLPSFLLPYRTPPATDSPLLPGLLFSEGGRSPRPHFSNTQNPNDAEKNQRVGRLTTRGFSKRFALLQNHRPLFLSLGLRGPRNRQRTSSHAKVIRCCPCQ